MKITRVSGTTGKTHDMEIDITPQQIDDCQQGKGLIQEIMPNLTADEREFFITGIISEEWDDIFKSEKEWDETLGEKDD